MRLTNPTPLSSPKRDDELVVTRVSPSHYLNQDLETVWLDK
jgi:hypothetical protein